MHPWVGISDHVRLGVVTCWVTPELVGGVLEKCGVRDKKSGALPAGFMVYFTLALALFQQDSYDDVAEQLVGSIPELSESIPNKSSFTRARRRLGPRVLETLFRELAGPLAPVGLKSAFYRGMRLAAVDGFVLDVPDTTANRAAFGGPVKNGQPAGFPQARVVTLTECGTHAQIDAAVGGFNGGEPELAIKMADSAAGMLVIMDRGFPGVALWKTYTGAGAHLLIRARSSVAARPVEHLPDGTYLARMNLAGQKGAHPGGVLVRVIEYRVDSGEVVRLLTDLVDPIAYPAAELAGIYHSRWEAESAFRQIKTFQRGPAEVLRSGDPDLVRQEVWAHLVVHHCLTQVIIALADDNRIDPRRGQGSADVPHRVPGRTAGGHREVQRASALTVAAHPYSRSSRSRTHCSCWCGARARRTSRTRSMPIAGSTAPWRSGCIALGGRPVDDLRPLPAVHDGRGAGGVRDAWRDWPRHHHPCAQAALLTTRRDPADTVPVRTEVLISRSWFHRGGRPREVSVATRCRQASQSSVSGGWQHSDA
ncbi:IS4 family transposase [Streptomyces sp. NPDC057592]|uniref:IS4 family transposase n=1 Tax=unclassified Streptomyces TaxID=2593676 RepID=UPI0036AEC4DE